MRARAALATLALAAAALAGGCAEALPVAAACERPAALTVTLASGPLLNPDESGAPLPTEIRVHEVRDSSRFESAVFDEAWQPAGALAESIVSTQSVTLYPGETASLTLTPADDARALVGVAIVRQPAGRTWRVVVPVETLACGAHASLALRVDEYRIERAPEEM